MLTFLFDLFILAVSLGIIKGMKYMLQCILFRGEMLLRLAVVFLRLIILCLGFIRSLYGWIGS